MLGHLELTTATLRTQYITLMSFGISVVISLTLLIHEIIVEHAAVNLAEEPQESLTRWDLPEDKLVAVTTDNVRNVLNATEILSW